MKRKVLVRYDRWRKVSCSTILGYRVGSWARVILGAAVTCSLAVPANAAAPSIAAADTDAANAANTTLSAASLNISDQLDLLTSNIFTGGTNVASRTLNVFITSTLAASKPSTSSSTKYQDSELLLQNGGVLNLFISTGTVTYKTEGLQKNTGDLGRDQISDRLYLDKINAVNDKENLARGYVINGVGVKLLNRNTDTTTSSDIANYGVGAMAYIGLGVDGTLSTLQTPTAGNFRLEAAISGSWTDSVSMHAMYPSTANPKTVNCGVIGNLQIAVLKQLAVNVHAGWPFGGARGYMGKVLLAGITLSR